MGLEEVVHILCDAGAAGPVFADALPEGEQEVRAVLMLEQQIDLVNIDPGIPPLLAVADDTVEDAVQHHQHAHGQKLTAQVPDVIAEDAGIGVHIGGFGEGVQAALGEQFDGQRHVPRFRLRLAEQLGMEILQGGHRAGVAPADVLPIALGGAAVDDGLLLGGEFPGSHELLTQGQQKLGLQHHRVLPVAVALLHIHGVDVVGRGGGHLDHLAAQPLDEWPVLALRVDDDDVVRRPAVTILRRQGQPHHLPLGGEGLAGAGHAEDKAVGVEQLPAVGEDEVLADGILAVVHAALMEDLLGLERHEDGQRLGGKGAEGIDAAQAQGQRRHQPLRLLPVEGGELTQVLAGNGLEGFCVAVQFFLAVRQMHQRHYGEHHALVTGGEIVQHLTGFLALLFEVIWYNGGEVVVAVLSALPVGHIGFHTQQPVLHLTHRLVRGDGDHIDGQHERPV